MPSSRPAALISAVACRLLAICIWVVMALPVNTLAHL